MTNEKCIGSLVSDIGARRICTGRYTVAVLSVLNAFLGQQQVPDEETCGTPSFEQVHTKECIACLRPS